MKKRIRQAACACVENGRRLAFDAELLELNEPPSTAFYLASIAQEEFAKGFLLALVVRGIIPWNRKLLRAARDHTCKQLLCVVMDYLNPDLETSLERCDPAVLRDVGPGLPGPVADALNILRHEKIGRWLSSTWVWAEDPGYHRDPLAIADGKQDREKQDALYVRLARDGGVALLSSKFTRETVHAELDRGRRFASLTEGVLNEDAHLELDYQYQRVEEILRLLFASMAEPIHES